MVFLLVALVSEAFAFGFGSSATAATSIAQILFVIALITLLISLFIGLTRRKL